MMRHSDLIDAARRIAGRATAALVALALTACMVGPDYRRPEVALPSSFTADAQAGSALPAVAVNRQWWRLFNDATLDSLVDQALVHNHDLSAAVARVAEAEALAREAGATLFPQIDLRAGGSRSRASTRGAVQLPASTPTLRDSRSVALGTAFEIDLWGRLRRANEAARAQLLASRYARDTVELSVVSIVTSNYLALRAVDAALDLTNSTLASRRQALDIVISRLEGGVVSPLERYQAEGALAAGQAQHADLRRQRALAESQLALLTGQAGMRIAAGDLRALPLPLTPPAGLPSSLLATRPDIRQAEEQLVSTNALIAVARAAIYPNLALTASLGRESAALSQLFAGGAGTWLIGLAAAMPIFDGGRNAARVDQASARQQQALAGYEKTVHTAFKEVNDALVGLRENADGERAQAQRVQAAQKTLEIAQLRYAAGYSAFLEVLDAQRSTNDALLAYVATRQARLNSAVELLRALGGGWRDDFAAPAEPAGKSGRAG